MLSVFRCSHLSLRILSTQKKSLPNILFLFAGCAGVVSLELDLSGTTTVLDIYKTLKQLQYANIATRATRDRDDRLPIKLNVTPQNLYMTLLALMAIRVDWAVECLACPEKRPRELWVYLDASLRPTIVHINTIVCTGPNKFTIEQLLALADLYQEQG